MAFRNNQEGKQSIPMIDRRKFIALLAGSMAGLVSAGCSRPRPTPAVEYKPLDEPVLQITQLRIPEPPRVPGEPYLASPKDHHPDNMIRDQLAGEPGKLSPPADVILDPVQRIAFNSALARLRRLQNYVGYGNFNIIGWDESLRLAQQRDAVGAFAPTELELIEQLFFTNAATLGFYGDKVVSSLSATIVKRDIEKIPRSGHFLFKGDSLAIYHRIRRDLGDSVVLTSGIRSVVKQIYLFMNKAEQVDGNLSLASYSLAPPGHSYHAVGDFDVGKKGFGSKNFSEAFAHTDEFKRLIDLGYLRIRYPQQNPFGVRYEPWHIKVV
jgi:hypothetical protein